MQLTTAQTETALRECPELILLTKQLHITLVELKHELDQRRIHDLRDKISRRLEQIGISSGYLFNHEG